MIDKERVAFWRGYKDFRTYVEQRKLGRAQACDSLYAPIWRPLQGHEDAYIAGWENGKIGVREGTKGAPGGVATRIGKRRARDDRFSFRRAAQHEPEAQ